MAENTSHFHQELLTKLDAVRRKENRQSLLYGTLAVAMVVIILPLAAVLLEEIFLFGTLGRTLLAIGIAAAIALSAAWFIARPLLRIVRVLPRSSYSSLAVKAGDHFPAIKDRLLNALQLYESRDKLRPHYSLALIDAAFEDLFRQVKPLDFTDAVSGARVRTMRKFALYVFSVALLVLVVSPSGFLGSLNRIVHYGESFASPLPIRFLIEPGNTEVVRGQNVPVTIRTEGRPVRMIALFTRQVGQLEFESRNLRATPENEFRTELSAMKASTEYYAAAEDIKSTSYTIKVLDRPLIRDLHLTVASPAYTRIPPRTLDDNVGDVSAYPGSRISIRVHASKPLAAASMVFGDSTALRLAPSGAEAEGVFTVRKNTSYHLLLKDSDNLPNVDPVEYAVKVIPDEFPTAEILSPAKNIDLTEEMTLRLFIRIKDDFGFSRLHLAYRMAQSRYEKPAEEYSSIDIPLDKKITSPYDMWYEWDLSPLSLVPEDAVAYYVEVFDNDDVNGPKAGRSETYIVRLPSIEEVFSDVSQTHEQSVESMQSIAKETEQLKQDIEDLQRELKKKNDKMDWQQQKKVDEMVQRYDAMKKKIEETSQKMDEMVKKMEENKLLSNETLEKYLELNKLMEKLNSPELKDALKKLQESMKQLSPEEMRQAMNQLQFSEEQFRKSLERTIELLKRIHIEQKLDELVKRTEELKNRQEEIRNQASREPGKREELTARQQDLQKQMDSLQQEASSLEKMMEEFPKEMPTEEMSKANQQLAQQQIGKKMSRSAQQIQQGDMQGAQQNQQETEQNLEDFKQQMQQAQKSLRDRQMKQIANQLRKQLENVIELSKREEALKDETKQLDPNSQRFRENAQRQNEVMNDLGNVAEGLGEIGKKSFAVTPEMAREIGNAMSAMGESMRQMEGRNPAGSSGKQGKAMGSLNRAAMMMQGALGQMMGNSGQGMGMAGLMGMLGQMANAQGGINSGTEKAMGMGQGQGEGLTSQQQAEYGRLAAQQAAVQKSLKELSNEAKNAGEFSKLLGDLDKVAQDMQEVQTDLAQGNVNPNTLHKQERILSRLLDSQRSMRERDYEKRRKAEAGKDILHASPTEIDLTTQEGKNRLREEMLKVLEGKYSKDYEELIRKYFEQLQEEEKPNN